MIFRSRFAALVYQSGKKLLHAERHVSVQFASVSSLKKIDFDTLEVPSRYADVPISNQPYFEYVWENRAKHFGKVAMVRWKALKNRLSFHSGKFPFMIILYLCKKNFSRRR